MRPYYLRRTAFMLWRDLINSAKFLGLVILDSAIIWCLIAMAFAFGGYP